MGGVYRRGPPTTSPPTGRDAIALWPLFGLRIRSEHLVLRLPTDDELIDLARAGPVRHPRARRDALRRRLDDAAEPRIRERLPASTTGDARDVAPENGGSTSMVERDGESSGPRRSRPKASRSTTWSTPARGSARRFQRRGIGKEMRAAVLAFAFDAPRRRVAESAAFLDNAASNAVSRASATNQTGSAGSHPRACRGRPREYRMTGSRLARAASAAGRRCDGPGRV